MPKTLYLIDGHAQIYRAYYAPFRPLTSPAGEPIKAVYVFCSMLLSLIRERKPDYLAMTMDVSDETVFRRDIFTDYKAHRDPPPEDLPPQADQIVELVQTLGIPVLRIPGFEADDLMATLATNLASEDLHVYLVSKDKDLEQLLTESVHLFDPGKNKVIDVQTLQEEKGYTPAQAVDIQTLTGDNTDNIPGVPGIGAKTAAKLIAKYGSAENVLANADKLTPKQRENVIAFTDQMPITRQLVTLKRDVPLQFELTDADMQNVDFAAVDPAFADLGFHRLRDQLATFLGESAPSSNEPSTGTAIAEPPAVTKVETIRYELIDTVDKLEALTKELANVSCFAIDTETTSLNPVAAELAGVSLCWKSGIACYIPIRAAVGEVVPIESVQLLLGPILSDPKIGKVGQNIKYDAIVLRNAGLEINGIVFDTMIASFVLEPLRRSHGIDALAEDLLGHKMIPISELIGKGKNQITIDQVPSDQVGEYASEDADFTWRLHELFKPQIEDGPFRSLFEQTEMPLVEVLAEMEFNGVKLDVDVLAKMGEELGERIESLMAEIHSEAGYAFNIDSTKQLAVVLFDEMKLPVIKKTKTGRSTDAATLEALAEQTDHPIPKLMLEYRELIKLKNTYVDTLPTMVCAKTGRLHAGFNQTGAVTGRLSSSDPNLQNIPVRTQLGRRIRQAFVAEGADRKLLVADYSQIELRILAHFSRDEALLEAFNTNQDIHAFVAAQVHGIDLADVTSEQRSAAKAVNFGIVYGQTAFGLSRSLGISQTEAKQFIDQYHARYPLIKRFIDQCIDETRARGYAETILGRRRPILELSSRNRQQVAQAERLAVNTVIQGSAADLIKRAMIDIHRHLKETDSTAKMLIQVHDELVFEVPTSEIESHKQMIEDKMTNAIPLDVPIIVDIGVGDNWLEAK